MKQTFRDNVKGGIALEIAFYAVEGYGFGPVSVLSL
jgi:hypothetical protein